MDKQGDIRKRMIAAAAKSWGINISDMSKVDPIISLLIDAIAGEIERVSSSIEEARNTMGNKLMELITPESLISPFPARAILYAHPFDASFVVTPDHQFYVSKNNPFEEDGVPIELFFTPVRNQTLINGEIKYIAAGNSMYVYDNPLDKTMLLNGRGDKTLPPDTIWFALSLDKIPKSLDEVSIYFNLEQAEESEEKAFYQSLAQSIWTINDRSLIIEKGFETISDDESSHKLHLPHNDINKAKAICKHSINFYGTKYLSLIDKKGHTRDINDLLKPGGWFISSTACMEEDDVILTWINRLLFIPARIGMLPTLQFLKIPKLEANITHAGFKIAETESIPFNPAEGQAYVVGRFIAAQKERDSL